MTKIPFCSISSFFTLSLIRMDFTYYFIITDKDDIWEIFCLHSANPRTNHSFNNPEVSTNKTQ